MCECKRCGNCCSNFLPLSKKEIKDLKQIVKQRNLKPISGIFGIGFENSCPFLNGNICVIYEDRPVICRIFTCEKFNNGDYRNTKELFKEERMLTDLRKEIFKK